MLKVVDEPQDSEYKWTKGNHSGTGRKLECILVSEDATQYCQGIYKKFGKEPKATESFQKAVAKYTKGTIWKVSKVSLATQNPKYLGCSCKVVIDMNTSSFDPVLQSTAPMPSDAAPPEDLATLLKCPEGQVVDVIALVVNVSEAVQKTTSFGIRDLVDVTIMDDSGTHGAASCQFPAWFPKTLTSAPSAQLRSLKEAAANRTPMAFFNLVVQKEEATTGAPEHGAKEKKTTLKTSRDKFTFRSCDEGVRAQALRNNAAIITATDSTRVTIVTEMPTYVKKDIDYVNAESTLTACRLLAYIVESGRSGTPGDTTDTTLFQINHARVLEPTANANILTNAGDRLFPTVRVVDSSGTFTGRMREKAALDLSGQESKEAFADLASKGALNFPILCSLRVAVRKDSGTCAPEQGGGAENHFDAIIVEAAEQDFLCPRAMPNASMSFLSELMRRMPSDTSKMLAAPIAAVRHVRHAGMFVDMGASAQLQASCVLSLVANIGRSEVKELSGGNKLITQGCWNVPFEEAESKDDGAPEHADKRISGELASYCNAVNVQDYTLTGRKAKEPVYAMIIISSVQEASGVHTYMVDKVNTHMVSKENIPAIRALLRNLARISLASDGQGKLNKSPDWLPDQTPYTAKKARLLGRSPTDDAMMWPAQML